MPALRDHLQVVLTNEYNGRRVRQGVTASPGVPPTKG